MNLSLRVRWLHSLQCLLADVSGLDRFAPCAVVHVAIAPFTTMLRTVSCYQCVLIYNTVLLYTSKYREMPLRLRCFVDMFCYVVINFSYRAAFRDAPPFPLTV